MKRSKTHDGFPLTRDWATGERGVRPTKVFGPTRTYRGTHPTQEGRPGEMWRDPRRWGSWGRCFVETDCESVIELIVVVTRLSGQSRRKRETTKRFHESHDKTGVHHGLPMARAARS